MARRSRFEGFVNGVTKGQAEKPALSVKAKLSQLKAKANEINNKLKKEEK